MGAGCKVSKETIFVSVASSLDFCLSLTPKQALVVTCLQYKSFGNTAGKGEIARNEQFLLFPQCFLSVWRKFCHFHQIQNFRFKNTLRLEESKICRVGKGKTIYLCLFTGSFQRVLRSFILVLWNRIHPCIWTAQADTGQYFLQFYEATILHCMTHLIYCLSYSDFILMCVLPCGLVVRASVS